MSDESGFAYGEVTVVKDSGDAILCKPPGRWSESFWVPKSQLHDDSEVEHEGDEGMLVVTEYLATERGWV